MFFYAGFYCIKSIKTNCLLCETYRCSSIYSYLNIRFRKLCLFYRNLDMKEFLANDPKVHAAHPFTSYDLLANISHDGEPGNFGVEFDLFVFTAHYWSTYKSTSRFCKHYDSSWVKADQRNKPSWYSYIWFITFPYIHTPVRPSKLQRTVIFLHTQLFLHTKKHSSE